MPPLIFSCRSSTEGMGYVSVVRCELRVTLKYPHKRILPLSLITGTTGVAHSLCSTGEIIFLRSGSAISSSALLLIAKRQFDICGM